MVRAVARVVSLLFAIVLFLAADYIYSTFLNLQEDRPRYPHPVYHHALLPNFDGYELWGEAHYRFATNSLGFRDARVRDVPLAPTTRRILLIGDSFTEATGLTFEESYAGRLYAAGMQSPGKVEFLNAGVLSYSPTLYYQKVKYFLEHGLRFDELVVFSDVSDVYDESRYYFCQDDDPKYEKYCNPQDRKFFASLCPDALAGGPGSCDVHAYGNTENPGWGVWMSQHFSVTNAMRVYGKFKLQQWSGNLRRRRMAPEPASGWLFSPNPFEASDYGPLGSAKGMARSLEHMQALADLLKRFGIPLTIVVYPWPVQLALPERDNRQVSLWRNFCATNCKQFIDANPAFLAEARDHPDWYERLFIDGDTHFSAEGSRLMFDVVAPHLLPPR